MIIHHVEHYTESRPMALIDQLPQFAYAAFGIFRLACIPAFGRKIVVRIVAPVIVVVMHGTGIFILLICLVRIVKVQHRHQLNMRNAQFA